MFWLCCELQIDQSYCSLREEVRRQAGSVCHMLCPCGSNQHVSPGPSKGQWKVWELPRVDPCHSTPGAAVSWVVPGATSTLGWPEPEPCSLFVSDGPTDVVLSWPGICSAAVPGLFPPLARCPTVHGDAPVRALAPLPAPQSAGFAHASQMLLLCCQRCHIPDPLSLFFMPLHLRNTGAGPAAVFHPPAMLTSWVASAHPWVGGRSGAGRGRSGRSGRGIKPGLFLYCKVITRAFQSLICREHPSAIGSLPEPGNNSPITRLLRQSPVNSHTWAHAGIHVLWSCQHVCPPHSLAAPSPGTRMGTPFWTVVVAGRGGSHC